MDLYHYLFKFIIIGDSHVGKSCLLLNYIEKKFKEEHDTTIGVEFGSQIFKYKDKVIKIQIWDTAGQESFRSITRSYYKGSIGVILQFDLTLKESFYNVQKWLEEVKDCNNDKCVITLVGNKKDLEEQREVSYDEAKEYADQNQMIYFETSAKTGYNVDLVFETMGQLIYDKIDTLDFENNGIKLGTYYQKQEIDDGLTPQKDKQNTCC